MIASSRGQFVVFDDALQRQSAGDANNARRANQHGKGAGEMPRGALSNITNNNGGAGRQQTREKQKVAGNQHADPAVPLRSNSSGETADAVSLRLPPTVPGRSPPRIVHAPGRLTDQDQDQDKDQGGGDACGSNDDGPWLGSIFSSAASSTRSSIVSPRDMDDFLARSAPSDAAAALRAMALQDNDENDELGARNDGITPLSTQQQKHLSSPAPQGYEDYAPESAEDGPEHSWWECDYCGLAFNTFDDASTHEAGCTLNQQHAASIPSGKCLSPITEMSQEGWQYSPSSSSGSPPSRACVSSPSPAVLSRNLFSSPRGQHPATRPVSERTMEPSLEVACSPGVQLTATLCYANNETSASPYAAAATSHVNNGILRGSSSPMVPPSSEPGELDAAAHVSPGVCASAAEHQRETEQLRAQFQKIEADHMKHIEGLQAALMSANEALMEMNQKLEVQSRQESIVLERVQVSDQRNSQLTSDVRLRDELLDEAKKAIDQARQLACAEQKRHSAVTSELNCHIKTLAHEVERQRGRADAAEDALRREKSNTQRLQELVIQARTGGASPAAVCRPHPSSGMRRSSRCSSTHYSGSSQPEHCSSPMVVMATTAMSTGMPLQRSSSPSPSHFSTSSPSPHVAVPQPWNGSQGCLSMTSSIRSDRSSSPASASFSASLPGSPKMRGVAGPSPSSSPLSSPRSRHQHMASFVSPPPPQLPSNTINPAFSAPNPRPMHSSTSPPPQHNNDTPWSHQATRRPTPLGLSLSPSDAGASSPFGPVLIRFEPEWQIRQGPIYKAASLPRPSSVASSASSSRSASPYASPSMRPMAALPLQPLRFDQPMQAW